MKNKYLYTIILLLFLLSNSYAQYNLSFFSKCNYWEHTDLYGISIGSSISKKISNIEVQFSFSYGYGENNRYDSDFPDLDTTIPSLLITDYKDLKETIGGGANHPETIIGGSRSLTDHASQLQIDISTQYNFHKKSKSNLFISLGGFLSSVSQFYIVDVLYGYELTDHFYIEGPMNIAIISHQKFITAGIMSQLGINYKLGKNSFSTFLDLGLGYRKTSYIGIGIKAGGLL